jgi:hypothetical protein
VQHLVYSVVADWNISYDLLTFVVNFAPVTHKRHFITSFGNATDRDNGDADIRGM